MLAVIDSVPAFFLCNRQVHLKSKKGEKIFIFFTFTLASMVQSDGFISELTP